MKYIMNKTAGSLILLGGRITIPVGGNIQVEDEVASDPHVKEVESKGWVEINAYITKPELPEVPKVTFAVDPMKGSKYPPGKEPKEEPVVEVAVETAAEADSDAPKRGRKAATK